MGKRKPSTRRAKKKDLPSALKDLASALPENEPGPALFQIRYLAAMLATGPAVDPDRADEFSALMNGSPIDVSAPPPRRIFIDPSLLSAILSWLLPTLSPTQTILASNPYFPLEYEHVAELSPTGEKWLHDSFASQDLGHGVRVVRGKVHGGEGNESGPLKVACYYFDSKKFTVGEAQAWLAAHGIRPAKFMTAKGSVPLLIKCSNPDGMYPHQLLGGPSKQVAAIRLDIFRRNLMKSFDLEEVLKKLLSEAESVVCRRGSCGPAASWDAWRAILHAYFAIRFKDDPDVAAADIASHAFLAGRAWERLIAQMKYDADIRDKNHQKQGKARENEMRKAMSAVRAQAIRETYPKVLERQQRDARTIGETVKLDSVQRETARLVAEQLKTRFGQDGERLGAQFGQRAQRLAQKRPLNLLEPVKANTVRDIISGRSAKRSRKKTAGA
jgi:hypothetical protein